MYPGTQKNPCLLSRPKTCPDGQCGCPALNGRQKTSFSGRNPVPRPNGELPEGRQVGIAQRHAAESQKSNTPTENGHNGKSRSNKPHSDIFWGVPDLVDVQEEPWAVGCQHIVWEG